MSEELTNPLVEDPNTPGVFGDEIDYSKSTVACSFVTGAAGTGKTYQLRQRIEADPSAGILCATTGVAAVNLGTTTLNSVLKFFDTDSLRDNFVTGKLQRRLIELGKMYRALMIDEISMMDADQLDIITEAASDANARLGKTQQLEIVLTGDFCQLPPVNAKWAFQAHHWDKYAANMQKLTKIWRQEDQPFVDALNLARSGKGAEAAAALRSQVKWSVAQENAFQGTTIFSKNDDVDKFNRMRYMQLQGKELRFKSLRWGKQRSEWKNIPEAIQLKIGAYVMILTNAPRRGPSTVLDYANGDQGYIVDFGTSGVVVRLDRTGEEHLIPFITRKVTSKEAPEEYILTRDKMQPGDPGYADAPYVDDDGTDARWVYGGITYLPVRLAYAATVHKTQGLTLDNVQIDIRGHFFGSPNMAYVGLSRVKSPKGLRIVGTPELLARRINIAQEVLPWV